MLLGKADSALISGRAGKDEQGRRTMSEISDYQTRISAALDRIGAGLGALAKSRDPGDADALAVELAAERAASAQLAERIEAIRAKQDTKVAALEAKVASLIATVEKADMRLHRHKRRIGQLVEIANSLRQSLEKNLSDPDLVNRALQAELEALRSTRAHDAQEISAILAEMEPLVQTASEETSDA